MEETAPRTLFLEDVLGKTKNLIKILPDGCATGSFEENLFWLPGLIMRKNIHC